MTRHPRVRIVYAVPDNGAAFRLHEANSFATDFDPEDLDHAGGKSEEESSAEDDENAGREHYQAVG